MLGREVVRVAAVDHVRDRRVRVVRAQRRDVGARVQRDDADLAKNVALEAAQAQQRDAQLRALEPPEGAIAGDAPLEREAGSVDQVEDARAPERARKVLQRILAPGVDDERRVRARERAAPPRAPTPARRVEMAHVEERSAGEKGRGLRERRGARAPLADARRREEARERGARDELRPRLGRLRHDGQKVDAREAGEPRQQLERTRRSGLRRNREDAADQRHDFRTRIALARRQIHRPRGETRPGRETRCARAKRQARDV